MTKQLTASEMGKIGIEETWRADAAENRVCELENENAILRQMLNEMYDAPCDCTCSPFEETPKIWEKAKAILCKKS